MQRIDIFRVLGLSWRY